MNQELEAAEQLVRVTVNGAATTLKLSGKGAKNAVALIMALEKQGWKSSGAVRMRNMIKQGATEIISIRPEDTTAFAREAKKYGVRFCMIRDAKAAAKDQPFDMMIFANDEQKVARILEKLGVGNVEMTHVEKEVEREVKSAKEKEDKAGAKPGAKETKDKATSGAETAKDLSGEDGINPRAIGNEGFYKYFYDYDREKADEFLAEHPGWHRIFGTESQGLNGGTYVIYRDVDDLPPFLRHYAREEEAVAKTEKSPARENTYENPAAAKTDKNPPSRQDYTNSSAPEDPGYGDVEGGTPAKDRPSVRKRLREITDEMKEKSEVKKKKTPERNGRPRTPAAAKPKRKDDELTK